MKHVHALKLNNVLVFVVMGLLQLIVINNKKQGVGFEERLGPF
jgi:hypothetical protein